MDYVLGRALIFALVIPAIVVHEVSHGWVAYSLGDPTAKTRGRLSLNPLKHVDPFGTVLLPLLLVAMGAPVFGYAKPVPVNPMYFKDRRMGMMLVGVAGPTSNLIMAIAGGIVARVGWAIASPGAGLVGDLGFIFAEVNLVLMFFNLIPLPPLDGSRVLPLFLTDGGMRLYRQWERYGILIIFALIFFGPRLLGFSPLGVYFAYTVDPLIRLFTGV